MAAIPIASVISANPPPEVAHIARTPMWLAPMHMPTTEISSSTCRTQMPSRWAWFANHSRMWVAGLIG